MKPLILPAALLLAAVNSLSWAQSPADHEAHHPDQKGSLAATQPPPSDSQPGMMGQGMMGGPQGMMGGNMPMMNMMQMMGRLGAETGCAGMSGMAIDHVEGRIAFLRAELKITDAQSNAWNAFADALRANAKGLGEARALMMAQQGGKPQDLVDRLTLQEKWLGARLEGVRAIKSALTNLAGTFSEDQRKSADELLEPHMSMGAMACAMQSGQVGAGQPAPGQMMHPGMMMQGR